MEIEIPKPLKKAIKNGYVISMIQFGSSLRKLNYKDIDLAVIVKKGFYKKFLEMVYGNKFSKFDISLIKEEEVQNSKKFRFGKHGAHFLFSLIEWKIIYGKNPFKKFTVSKSQIEKSILLSLFYYMEDARRVIFKSKLNKNIKKRWPKFVKLCLYLLDDNLEYPKVLDLDNDTIKKYYKININLDSKKAKELLTSYEIIWQKVLAKRRLIKT